jgi:hypothetical protein
MATPNPSVLLAAVLATAAACATAHKSAAPDPAVLASIPGEPRVVNGETTWVARGVGYELVTRSKLEIPPLLAQLDDQSRYFTKEFGVDAGKVIATVRRVGPPGAPVEASAPVPYDVGPVVELLVPRPLVKGEKAAPAEQESEHFAAAGPTAPVVRAWLSAHATALTGKRASDLAASARADDPRVPAWAEDALPGLAVPTGREDTTTARLAMEVDSLYPVYTFLTMARPATIASTGRGAEGRGSPGGRGGGLGGGTGGGGMGGGGMGGGGMGGGGMGGGFGGMGRRGGYGGGTGGSSRGGAARGGEGRGNYRGALSGNALFAAEALVFGRYLTIREGPAFVGALIDAQIRSQDIAAVFAKAQMVPSNLERLDIEFHRWLIDRATQAK